MPLRNLLIPLACAALPAAALPLAARAADPTHALYAALAGAKGGERIELPGGTYEGFFLGKSTPFDIRFPQTVTIASADPANPAVFTDMDLRGVANLAIEDVVFDYTWRPGAKLSQRAFTLSDCQNVAIRNALFDGDLIRGQGPRDDGLATAVAISIRGCDGAVFENNRIERFFRGLVMSGGSGNVVAGNELRQLRMDGMNFAQVEDVLIEGNYIHDFARSAVKEEHADMIQFWTNNTSAPSRGITIRNNVLLAGEGDATQSIFMRNDLVDRGKAGREMFYRDVLIEGNVIVNGHLHGISVGETDGLTIRNNTVLRGERFAAAGDRRDRSVTIPQINVNEAATRVTVTGNLAGGLPPGRPGWTVQGNMLVQNVSPTRPGYYHTVFVDAILGDPRVLDSFAYRPGGPADAAGIGSPLLAPGGDRARYRPRPRAAGLRRWR